MSRGPNYDDGGGAFPSHELCQTGMTLRDYFAAAAIPIVVQGMAQPMSLPDDFSPGQFAAAMAYSIADAMLAERAK